MCFIRSHGSTTLLVRGPAAGSTGPEDALVRPFLEDQGELSAVERFAQLHEGVHQPLQGRYYSALMPALAPGPGEQYAFEVDLDRCSGCKACVAACHNLNGLDEGEAWREVGLVLPLVLSLMKQTTGSFGGAFLAFALAGGLGGALTLAYVTRSWKGILLGEDGRTAPFAPASHPTLTKADAVP